MPEIIVTFDDRRDCSGRALIESKGSDMSICFANVLVGIVSGLTVCAVSALAWFVISETVRLRKEARAFEQMQKQLNEIQDKHIH